jgi:hypothetical protein
MREIWLESWLARHGIESLDGKVKILARNDPPRYNVMIATLCLA